LVGAASEQNLRFGEMIAGEHANWNGCERFHRG
jgi:hypothetical protein